MKETSMRMLYSKGAKGSCLKWQQPSGYDAMISIIGDGRV